MKSNEVVIKMENVYKTFSVNDNPDYTIRERVFNAFKGGGKRKIHALKNVNLEIKRGEFFGVMGRNGSGKSTLLNIMTGAYPPDRGGKVKIVGKFMRLALGMGFDKELTARENIYINASIFGLSLRKIGTKLHEIIEFAELEDFVNTKVKFFSSGMRSRLMFAIALHAEADIFLMDEFFGGVGDESFQEKCREVFKKSFIEGRTIVHVSHSLSTIEKHCDRVLLLDKGDAVALGPTKEIVDIYKAMMKDKPRLTKDEKSVKARQRIKRK